MSAPPNQSIRFERLQQVCDKALEESQKALSDENVASCYPSLTNSQQGQQLLQMVKAQLMSSWRTNSEKEFEAIFEERDIRSKLDELDALIADAQTRKENGGEAPIAIDQLNPVSIVASHLIPVKEANLKHLQAQLSQIKESNSELLKDLQGMVEEAGALNKEVTTSMEGVEKLLKIPEEADLQHKLKELAEILSKE